MTDPTTPGARTRPATVTVSSYLLYLYAALGLIGVVVGLSVVGTMTEVYRDAYEGTDAEGMESFVTISTVGAAVLSLIFAAAFVVLALFNNRGKNASRIVTWVLGGISLCCTGIGLAFTAAGNSMGMGSSSNGNMPDPADVQRQLDDALPGWYTPISTIVSVLALLVMLVALILLALPPSNEFFRKPAPAWEPPVPGSAYPAYPQVPPASPSAPSAPPAPSGESAPPPAAPPSQPGPSSNPPDQPNPPANA
ncbi:hypothetical protein WEI85_08940 [Actinomycetes bacterium KLBMP 9797]